MEPYTRRVDIKVTVDVWDWEQGQIKKTEDITEALLSYRFQKTIKNPKGSCQIQTVPQFGERNIIDELKPMDAIKVYEFGDLKFQGYITRVSYSGSIDRSSGKPNRSGVLTVSEMGGLLVDAKTGMGLGTALGDPAKELVFATLDLSTALLNEVQDGTSFADLLGVVIDSVKQYIKDLGGADADAIINYLETYISYGPGLDDSSQPLSPREFILFSGNEQTIGLWQILTQLMEQPFNECFIDNGPRKIDINGNPKQLNDTSHIIFRPTPFDGTVGNGSTTVFRDMEAIEVDNDHLLKFDLAKSMDEVYTTYLVKNEAFDPGDNKRQLLGEYYLDGPKLGKYLFRPLVSQQYYTRFEKTDSTDPEGSINDITNPSQDLAQTLKAWFEHNDEYLSGAITMMVPSDNAKDPKIGTKITVAGMDGAFYVEAIAHTWTYQGALQSNLTVTRGFNGTQPIELTDKIFHRNQFK